MKKFAIHISGQGCSGKTTLTTALGEKFPGMYMVAFDKLKWQISGYHRDKYSDLIKDIELGLFEVICKKHIPTTLDYFCADEKEYAACKAIADAHGYIFISVELTAPKEVLLARFRERVARAKQMGTKISITDEALFVKLLKHRAYVPPGTPLFDTSVTSIADIVSEIERLLS